MTSLQFYLLFVLAPNFDNFLCLLVGITFVGSICCFFVLCTAWSEGAKQEKIKTVAKVTKRWMCALVVFALLSVFIPTTKQMAAMVALPYLSHVKNIDKVPSAIVSKLLEVLKEKKKKKGGGK